jgi:hypothetical protein
MASGDAPGDDDEEELQRLRWGFDLAGYCVLPGALSADHVSRLNEALDRRRAQWQRSPSLADASDGLRGARSFSGKLASALEARIAPVELLAQLRAVGFPPAHSKRPVVPPDGGAPRSLRGKATVTECRDALASIRMGGPGGSERLTAAEVEALVASCGGELEQGGVVSLGSSRWDVQKMLEWEEPDAAPFRELLSVPDVDHLLRHVLGERYRLMSQPSGLLMDKGSDGHSLHGGAVERQVAGGQREGFSFVGDTIRAGMVVVEFVLADEGPGHGGLVLAPGSHKANLATPRERWPQDGRLPPYLTEVQAQAGDAIVFCEALRHGSLKWRADHQRRVVIMRCVPEHYATDVSLLESGDEWVGRLSAEQRAVLRPAPSRL